MNLYCTVLTYPAPSSNYRGESEENRTVLQKLTRGGHDYCIISPAAMRNALREILAAKELPMNRRRLHDQDQLAVEFKSFPDATKYADDFLFGYMVADNKAIKENKDIPSKRDSVLRMNMAVALTPYRFNASFHQSPLNAGESPWKNAGSSALIHREISHTAYQYPFALHLPDCTVTDDGRNWTRALLDAIGELNGVAGGHAASYYEMAPRSLVARLTPRLAAGFDTYGFSEDGTFPELKRINPEDLPGSEFWLGGEVARAMPAEVRSRLEQQQVRFFDNPAKMLTALADEALGS